MAVGGVVWGGVGTWRGIVGLGFNLQWGQAELGWVQMVRGNRAVLGDSVGSVSSRAPLNQCPTRMTHEGMLRRPFTVALMPLLLLALHPGDGRPAAAGCCGRGG